MKTMRGAKAVIKRMSIIAVLLSGLILAGTSLASAKDCIRMDDKNKTDEEKYTVANRGCWERKARRGEEDLSNAVLLRGYLPSADLSKADLTGANLSKANLVAANLTGADLTWANLSFANLGEANLGEANLTGANLSGADLSKADLTGANLSKANLTGADLRDIRRWDAVVSRSTTKGVDFDHWRSRGGKVVD